MCADAKRTDTDVNAVRVSLASSCAMVIVSSAFDLACQVIEKHELTTSVEFTKHFTEGLSTLIYASGGRAFKEFGLDGCVRPASAHKIRTWGESARPVIAHLDVFANFPDASSLAIEIDRNNKSWSLDKLDFAKRNLNSECVWIRWRGPVKDFDVTEIPVLDISDACRKIRRPRRNIEFDSQSVVTR